MGVRMDRRTDSSASDRRGNTGFPLLIGIASLALLSNVGLAADTGPGTLMRRLTPEQYRNSVTDIFGPEIKIGGGFEPDLRVDGLLALGASRISITPGGLSAYHSSAHLVASQVFDESNRTLIPCKPADPTRADSACATEFFARVGALLYRRPLTPNELATMVNAAGKGADTLHDFYGGLRTTLAGTLSSVPFLFRIEKAELAPDGGYKLEAYSIASRLSFFLWNSGPDDTLLAAAKSGELTTDTGLNQQVNRMLKSQRVEAGARAFFDDMLGFDSFARLEKDTDIYPKYTNSVALDAREQTLRTIMNKLLTEQGDYRELFTDGKTFLTPLLASIYRVPVAPSGIFGVASGWTPYSFPKGDVRAGILAQVSFVALHSHPGRSSPTLRGKALREVFLCQKVPDPPANIDFTEFNDPDQPAKTTRERLIAHSGSPACAGCHKITDPLGLSLESFDALGAFRTMDNGVPIDTSGQLSSTKFKDAAGLAEAISRDPAVTSCLIKRLTAYAVGASAAQGTRPWVQSLEKQFAEDGYRYPALIRSIATSAQFARVDEPKIRATDRGARTTEAP